MVSRLELNGETFANYNLLWLNVPAERDKRARRNKDDGQAPEKVDSFRGVKFASWLRIFMQVSRRS